MLTRVVDWCLAHRVVVVLAALVVALGGAFSFRSLPFDAFPDTTPVQVNVNTDAPALSPLEVERTITFPIEQRVSGLPGLVEVRSISKYGLSQVTAVFDDDTDPYLARQLVSERLAAVELPDGVARPSLGPAATGLGEVFQYLITSQTLSAAELRTLHHWVVRPQLLQVPGVAEINTWGGFEQQYHVVVHPDRLLELDVTLDDLASALRATNRNAAGGLSERGGEARAVRGKGWLSSTADIRRVVVASRDGVPITVDDVATVTEGHEIRRGAVTAGGTGEVVLGLGFMLYGENSRELTRALEQRLGEAQRTLPDGVQLTPVYQRTTLVDSVLETVRNNLLEGALLVIAVVFLFMGNLRAGLIVASAIPLAMLFAFNGMLQLGVAGTLMSLGAIDFGLIVDSSVIAVENAQRHLDEATDGRSVRDIVRDAVIEVRRPTLFGELIIASVYLPVLLLEGVEGKLFRPMALTVIFALVGSMVLSLTLVPVLASWFLRPSRGRVRISLAPLLTRLYRPVLRFALRRRELVLGGALICVAAAAGVATTLGTEFVPRLRERAIVINTVRATGVSLGESVRYGTQLERHLLAQFPDEIRTVWTRTGSAEVATDPMGLEVSDVFITLKPRDQWHRASTQDELVLRMKESLDGMPGMRSVFSQPVEMRVNEMSAGIRSDVGIRLFGDDFAELERGAEKIRVAVDAIDGAADVTVEQTTGAPFIDVDVDRERAAVAGVPAAAALDTVAALGTPKVGTVYRGQQNFDLVLRFEDSQRASVDAIRQLPVRTADGRNVALKHVADVELSSGPATIRRDWGRRRMTIQANVRGRDIGSFVAEVREAVDAIDLPAGYVTHVGGQFEHMVRARERLLYVVPLALALVCALLYLTYGRWRDVLRVMTGVPFAAIGGVLALWLRGMPVSISAAIGFVALSGVAVLGDMVLVSRVRQLRAAGVELSAAVSEAASSRLRPVLMTALVAALGFVPMALNTGVGAEIQRPLATVVVGGVLSSTLATLVVLPVLYVATERKGAEQRSA